MNRLDRKTSTATRAITLILAASFVFSNIALVAMANDRSEVLATTTATAGSRYDKKRHFGGYKLWPARDPVFVILTLNHSF